MNDNRRHPSGATLRDGARVRGVDAGIADTVARARLAASGMTRPAGRATIPVSWPRCGSGRPARLADLVKERGFQGHAHDGAATGFGLAVRRRLRTVPGCRPLDRRRGADERRLDARRVLVALSEAVMTLAVDGRRSMAAAAGNGPANALDGALRQALPPARARPDGVRPTGCRARVPTPGAGAAAVIRALIGSADEAGACGTAGGVCGNVVNVSCEASDDSPACRPLGTER